MIFTCLRTRKKSSIYIYIYIYVELTKSTVESNETNILAKIHLLYLYLTCSHVENKKQKKQKQNKI